RLPERPQVEVARHRAQPRTARSSAALLVRRAQVLQERLLREIVGELGRAAEVAQVAPHLGLVLLDDPGGVLAGLAVDVHGGHPTTIQRAAKGCAESPTDAGDGSWPSVATIPAASDRRHRGFACARASSSSATCT